jgi:putative spermidine/putrescine transport system permease protein
MTTQQLAAPATPRRRLGAWSSAFDGAGARWLLIPPFLFLLLLLLVPIGFVAVLGFDRVDGKVAMTSVLGDEFFRSALWRTAVLATIVSVLTVFFGTLYAIGLAAAPRWLAVLMLIALFTIFWTSLLVRTYGWMLLYLPQGPIYQTLHGLGLRADPISIYQTNFASYPAMVHVMLPYVVLPVFAATRQLDSSQIRAARVLGAKPMLLLRKVILPALKPAIISGAILVFVMSLGFYVTPSLLGSQTGEVVAGLIGNDFSQAGQTPVAAAMSIVLLLIVIVVYVIADRIFRVSEQWGGKA